MSSYRALCHKALVPEPAARPINLFSAAPAVPKLPDASPTTVTHGKSIDHAAGRRVITLQGETWAVFRLRRERLVFRLVKEMPQRHGLVCPNYHITLDRAITKQLATRQGGDTEERARKPGGRNPVQAQTYEITFLGQAGTTLRAEFDDCEVTIGPGTTTLRTELPDRGALSGLMERINGLGLDVIDVSLVAPPLGL